MYHLILPNMESLQSQTYQMSIRIWEFVEQIPDTVYVIEFIIGVLPGILLLTYKTGILKWLIDKYNKIDYNNLLSGTILFLVLPFLWIYIINLDIKLNPVVDKMLIPFTTGLGIIIGNSIINYNQKAKEIKNLKKLLYLVLLNHKSQLQSINNWASRIEVLIDKRNEILRLLDKPNKTNEEAYKILNEITMGSTKQEMKARFSDINECILSIKTNVNYKKALDEQSILPIEELKILDNYSSDLGNLISIYEHRRDNLPKNEAEEKEVLESLQKLNNTALERTEDIIKVQNECISTLGLDNIT